MSKHQLAYAVHLDDPDGNPVFFGPGDDVPSWAAARIGDHAWEGGKAPSVSYDDQTKDELGAEIARRNSSRSADEQIDAGGSGATKADLVKALKADDKG